MLLEPRCTRLITDSRHPSQPDLEEPVSGNLLFKTKQSQAINQSINRGIPECSWAPSRSYSWGNLDPEHSILVRIFGFQQHSENQFFWDTLYTFLGEAGVSKSRYICISIPIKYSNFSRFYKKLGPFYKKLWCDKFGNWSISTRGILPSKNDEFHETRGLLPSKKDEFHETRGLLPSKNDEFHENAHFL